MSWGLCGIAHLTVQMVLGSNLVSIVNITSCLIFSKPVYIILVLSMLIFNPEKRVKTKDLHYCVEAFFGAIKNTGGTIERTL